VVPIPDTLLLRKSGSAGNQTRDFCISSQELLITRPQRWSLETDVVLLIGAIWTVRTIISHILKYLYNNIPQFTLLLLSLYVLLSRFRIESSSNFLHNNKWKDIKVDLTAMRCNSAVRGEMDHMRLVWWTFILTNIFWPSSKTIILALKRLLFFN
jgi:uncharacterized membrane protein